MTMRAKIVVAVAAVACVAATVPAQAAKPRREITRYEATDTTYGVGAGEYSAGAGTTDAGYYFQARDDERTISVMLLDDRDQPVSGVVAQYEFEGGNGTAGLGREVTFAKFCGRTEKPVKIDPDLFIKIIVEKGACEDGTPSVPTSGDIVVDFHRK